MQKRNRDIKRDIFRTCFYLFLFLRNNWNPILGFHETTRNESTLLLCFRQPGLFLFKILETLKFLLMESIIWCDVLHNWLLPHTDADSPLTMPSLHLKFQHYQPNNFWYSLIIIFCTCSFFFLQYLSIHFHLSHGCPSLGNLSLPLLLHFRDTNIIASNSL